MLVRTGKKIVRLCRVSFRGTETTPRKMVSSRKLGTNSKVVANNMTYESRPRAPMGVRARTL